MVSMMQHPPGEAEDNLILWEERKTIVGME